MTQAAENVGAKPIRGLDEQVPHEEMSPEEVEATFGDGTAAPDADLGDRFREALAEEPDAGGAPPWVVTPADLKFPPGRQVGFMLFRGAWTDTPHKGDRQCILWSLTEAEEKIAYKRARGDSFRAVGELSKQMIRAVDGQKVDWASGNVNRFWDDLGRRCCQMIQNYYVKTHTMSVDQQQDFFANCFAVRTAAAG